MAHYLIEFKAAGPRAPHRAGLDLLDARSAEKPARINKRDPSARRERSLVFCTFGEEGRANFDFTWDFKIVKLGGLGDGVGSEFE